MEFTIMTAALKKELTFIQGVVEKKNTIPILSNILVESSGDSTLKLTATDLDLTLQCEVEPDDIMTPGALVLPARKLFEIARLLPDAPVSFKKAENDWVNIRCGKSKYKLASLSPDGFPERQNFQLGNAKVASEILRYFITRTMFAITQEESRYTLSGAKLILEAGKLTMVTTDGHRMALVYRDNVVADKTEKMDTLIPRKTCAELLQLTADYKGEVSMAMDSNLLYFGLGNRVLMSRQLYGQFPQWEMVLPKNNDKTISVPSAPLNLIVQRALVMADERSHAVKVELKPGELIVSSQSADTGEANESIPVEYSGEEMVAGFNGGYLRDFLNVVTDGDIVIDLKDGNSQAQLSPATAGDFSYKYVVMPMRL